MYHPDEPARKRRRPPLSCIACRRRKIRCNREQPCDHCIQAGNQTCLYAPETLSGSDRMVGGSGTSTKSAESSSTSPAQVSQSPIALNALPTPNSTPAASDVASISIYNRPLKSHMTGPTYDAENPDSINNKWGRLSSQKMSVQGATPELPGFVRKSRYHGPTHFGTSMEQFSAIKQMAMACDEHGRRIQTAEMVRLHATVGKCKDLARKIKALRPSPQGSGDSLAPYIPPRALADEMMHAYLRNFESVYRILHIPSFLAQVDKYWTHSESVDEDFLHTYTLVLAIGAIFSPDGYDHEKQIMSLKWLYAAQSWVSAPYQKDRVSIAGLQIQCLILLARHIEAAAPDLIWIPVGSLIRAATQMGLHRDPSMLPKISDYDAEIRRRLWVTIVELAVQASVDVGMAPLITFEDFDTVAPRNVDDDQISAMEPRPPLVARPSDVFTQSSLQIALFASLPARLDVVQKLNHFRSKPTYDDILKLSSDLMKHIQDAGKRLKDYALQASIHGHKTPSKFHRNFFEHLVRRFVVALHRPFGKKSATDARYYYSRKIIVEQGLLIATPMQDDDFDRICTFGGAIFQEFITIAGFVLSAELIIQTEEDALNYALERNKPQRDRLRDAIIRMQNLGKERVRSGGETNGKGILFLGTVLGQVEAMEKDGNVKEAILQAATLSATLACDILRTRALFLGICLDTDKDASTAGSRKPGLTFRDNGGGIAGTVPHDPNEHSAGLPHDSNTLLNMSTYPELTASDMAVMQDFDFDAAANWLIAPFAEIPWT